MTTDAQKALRKAEREQVRLGHQNLLKLHLQAVGLPVPAAEFVFHPTRGWKIDFAWWFCYIDTCQEVRLALEVEGGIYGKKGGGHRSITGFESNLEKYNQLTIYGWYLIRVLPEWLNQDRNEARDLLVSFFNIRGIETPAKW